MVTRSGVQLLRRWKLQRLKLHGYMCIEIAEGCEGVGHATWALTGDHWILHVIGW